MYVSGAVFPVLIADQKPYQNISFSKVGNQYRELIVWEWYLFIDKDLGEKFKDVFSSK